MLPDLELGWRDAEYPFDAFRIANSDLNMRLPVESCSRIDGFTFGEYASDRVHWWFFHRFKYGVESPHDRAIQVSPKPVFTVPR